MTISPPGQPADANEQMRRRREKLAAWLARGVNPFGARFPVTHWAGTLQGRFKEAAEAELQSAGAVSLAGRVMAMRHHGKSCFAVLRDQTEQIQLYARADVLADLYAAFVDLDVGDFIGVTGELFRTRTGELTVSVKQFEFLTKALRPLPEKWHGLKNVRPGTAGATWT
jgi:lysyl-tRNA synthetase, class II